MFEQMQKLQSRRMAPRFFATQSRTSTFSWTLARLIKFALVAEAILK